MKRKVIAISSQFLSIIAGIICFLTVLPMQNELHINTADNAIISLLMTLCLMLIFELIGFLRNSKYFGIEKRISEKVLIREKILFRPSDERGFTTAYIYITENKFYLYSRDSKPYIEKSFDIADVTDIKCFRNFELLIKAGSTGNLHIYTPNAKMILDKLKKR